MRKFLPFIAIGIGILVLVGGFLFIRSRKTSEDSQENTGSLIDVPLEKRPIASLTPSDDGHWLKLKIEKIMIEGASTIDYELLYSLPDGRTQGVPGSVELKGNSSLGRELLLGSESSGKFRYDEGVEEGTLTLRFRNEKGKLIAKFFTKFHLQAGGPELVSLDGKLQITLVKTSKAFFVVMDTFGLPDSAPSGVTSGPYGVFSSLEGPLAANVRIGSDKVYRHITGPRWEVHEDGDDLLDSDSGVFIGSSQ